MTLQLPIYFAFYTNISILAALAQAALAQAALFNYPDNLLRTLNNITRADTCMYLILASLATRIKLVNSV